MLGMLESFIFREMLDLVNRVCGGEREWDVFESVLGVMEELKDRLEYCLDLNFMLVLMYMGYEMFIDWEVRIVK